MPPIPSTHLLRSFSTAAALRSVFLTGTSAARPVLGRGTSSSPLLTPLTTRRGKANRGSNDGEAILLELEQRREAERRTPAAVRFARPDRDEGIRARFVVLIDRRTNKPTEPQPLRQVLAGVDRKTEFLMRVGQAAAPGEPQLCKIMGKKEVFDQEDDKARQAVEAKKRKRRREGKTLELGWNTAEGDLAYRFKKAEQFIAKGERVNFVFENRQRRTVVPQDKAQTLLGKVKEAMEQIPQVAEVERDGKLGGKMKVVFERADAG